jgi:hypothetical protein
MWFTKSQILKCEPHHSANRTPTPSGMVSNGEDMPLLRTRKQEQVVHKGETKRDESQISRKQQEATEMTQ